MAGVGNTQIINGQEYTLYSPQWYAARDAEATRQAALTGKNQGVQAGTAATSQYQTQFPGYSLPTPAPPSSPSLQSLDRQMGGTMQTAMAGDPMAEARRQAAIAEAQALDQRQQQQARLEAERAQSEAATRDFRAQQAADQARQVAEQARRNAEAQANADRASAQSAAGAAQNQARRDAETQANQSNWERSNAEAQASAARARELADARVAQERSLAQLPSIYAMLTGGGGTAAPAPDPALAADARANAFAATKDKIGELNRSSLNALRATMAERGTNVAGGVNPALGGAEAKVITRGNQALTDVVRDQAASDDSYARDEQRRKDEMAITKRGQNLALAPSLISLMKSGGLY